LQEADGVVLGTSKATARERAAASRLLVHANRYGAVVIPEVACEAAKTAELRARREAPILKVARSPDFSLKALKRALGQAAEIH
jgi:hypothetical protein